MTNEEVIKEAEEMLSSAPKDLRKWRAKEAVSLQSKLIFEQVESFATIDDGKQEELFKAVYNIANALINPSAFRQKLEKRGTLPVGGTKDGGSAAEALFAEIMGR